MEVLVVLQVDSTHYRKEYLTKNRFIMYHKCLDIIDNLYFQKVLEIGPGPGILSYILKFLQKEVVTLDFDINLGPDVVCDVRRLCLKRNSFDLILGLQVFEHIDYAHFINSLKELSNVAKKYILISLPYNEHNIELYLNLKILRYMYFKGVFNKILMKIFPMYFYMGLNRSKYSFPGHEEHCWEIGYKEYPIGGIRRDIRDIGLKILKEYRVKLAPYYYFLLLGV